MHPSDETSVSKVVSEENPRRGRPRVDKPMDAAERQRRSRATRRARSEANILCQR